MAKNRSQSKDRLIEVLILAFVIVAVGLLVVQLGLNVADTLDQSSAAVEDERSLQDDFMLTLTPPAPTPTLDFSLPVSEGGS